MEPNSWINKLNNFKDKITGFCKEHPCLVTGVLAFGSGVVIGTHIHKQDEFTEIGEEFRRAAANGESYLVAQQGKGGLWGHKIVDEEDGYQLTAFIASCYGDSCMGINPDSATAMFLDIKDDFLHDLTVCDKMRLN